ncbi:toll/interleukin-1 receptor domain-containing protein [Fredinandcohnia onubensis]|uniref:toll/interleukin-1 receptor domain-containing protein n=1 Tax=Fredinandcohnia onubensis TaxID=1571209 RepID=UPI000C0BBBBB|nr:toll/interleukin-1 receptor domain-containing protein [Fredinandcohnia onubensis]
MERKTAFVTYSWDSTEHQQWVLNLTNDLRKNGVDATMDLFQTQSGTVNLNQMMITNIRDRDYVIIVLTEGYAERSDNFKGGVGFETLLSLPILLENPDKIILVMKHKVNFNDAFPFHLKGYYAINFSNELNYAKSLKELIHKIFGAPLYEMEPLGEVPDLKPLGSKSPISNSTPTIDFSDIEIPNLKRITDRDKEVFIVDSYNHINRVFEELFNSIKLTNPNFEYTNERITNTQNHFTLYIDGNRVTGVKMWISDSWGQKSINLSYGSIGWGFENDNSYNESIVSEVGQDKTLNLKMTMNVYGNNRDASTPDEIVKEIWKNNLSHHIR